MVVAARTDTRIGDLVHAASRPVTVDDATEYRLLGVRLDGNGPFLREKKLGAELSATRLYRVREGDFIYSRLFAWRGAFGIIPPELDSCCVSNEFPLFQVDVDRADARFLLLWFRLPSTLALVEDHCTGSTPLTRNRYKERFFLDMVVPLPSIDEQRRIVERIEELAAKIEETPRVCGRKRWMMPRRFSNQRCDLRSQARQCTCCLSRVSV